MSESKGSRWQALVQLLRELPNNLWNRYLSGRAPLPHAERRDILNTLWTPGLDQRDYFQNYAILLILSMIIATFGLLQNSTAVIIGAMLIAPLMTPVLGVAAGIIIGAPYRTVRQITIVAVSTVGAILLAWALTLLIPEVPGSLPSEVVARTSPNLIDLLIALAAGVAGAYARVKSAVADAIPGVAIAVALVPPLAVVGIAFEAGEWGMGLGALLLYLTNLVAIVLAGSLTFFFTGLSPVRHLLEGENVVVSGLRWALIAVLLVSIPLAVTGQRTLKKANRDADVSSVITTWVNNQEATGIDLEFISQEVSTAGDVSEVTIFVTGDEQPGGTNQLAHDLAQELGKPTTVTVRYIPFIEENATAGAED